MVYLLIWYVWGSQEGSGISLSLGENFVFRLFKGELVEAGLKGNLLCLLTQEEVWWSGTNAPLKVQGSCATRE